MRKGFDAGVAPGGIRNSYEVNILICYMLKIQLHYRNSEKTKKDDKKPIDFSLSYKQIFEILLKENIVNYFEFTNSLAELEELSQVETYIENGEKYYFLTKKGEDNLNILELELPKTIRERVALKVSNLNAQKKRLEKNRAGLKKVEDGYILTLEILDIGSNLLTLQVFVADELSAKAMEKKFLNNPILVYQSVMSALTGDNESLKKIIDLPVDEIF